MRNERDVVLATIRAAFPTGEAPLSVVEPPRLIEADQVDTFFRGRRWGEITLVAMRDDYVGDASACLHFMTPAAIAYYLPAYLVASVEHFDEAGTIAVTTLRRLREGVLYGANGSLLDSSTGTLPPVDVSAVL